MRISDWSSDVCSSDLVLPAADAAARRAIPQQLRLRLADLALRLLRRRGARPRRAERGPAVRELYRRGARVADLDLSRAPLRQAADDDGDGLADRRLARRDIGAANARAGAGRRLLVDAWHRLRRAAVPLLDARRPDPAQIGRATV